MKFRADQAVFILGDAVVCTFSILLAVCLRYDWNVDAYIHIDQMFIYSVISIVSIIGAGVVTGAYSSIWTFIGFIEVVRQALIAVMSAIVLFIFKLVGVIDIPVSVIFIYFGIVFILTTAIRSTQRITRWIMTNRYRQNGDVNRVVVVGAGAAGAMLIKRLRANSLDGIYPVAAVDDDPAKKGMQISGVRVSGGLDDIEYVVSKYLADEIVIAIPSASSEELTNIYNRCKSAKKPIKVFQSVVDIEGFLAGNKKALREVSIEDLLFRDAVKSDMSIVKEYISDKTILVTGGAGSIGSEICRQVLEYGCGKLIVFDLHENGLFELNEELKDRFDNSRYRLCMGSVRDEKCLSRVFDEYRPDMVLHAAAHKHVPMMECNPFEAVKNNIFGTLNTIRCCLKYGTKRFLLISTDKAVHPTNVMGATKRAAELLVQIYNGQGCDMCAVRFGNVLDSNGSVIPIFRRQIAEGGPVTVTHPDVTRYFMTIPEAVSLVLSAAVISQGGEIFILDMGKPRNIFELAKNMISLSGYTPDKDIKIKFVGLRPGEKLYEELSHDSEDVSRTEHEKIFVLRAEKPNVKKVNDYLNKLGDIIYEEHDSLKLRNMLFFMIGEEGDHKKQTQLRYARDEEPCLIANFDKKVNAGG
ncbi:MAG: polysaccharide biosynthesis protein [Clostridiales bacterium]|nr:polysaccharide biosynthesis protein [Clostridiales bacterium]